MVTVVTPMPVPAPSRTMNQVAFDAANAARIAAEPLYTAQFNAAVAETNENAIVAAAAAASAASQVDLATAKAESASASANAAALTANAAAWVAGNYAFNASAISGLDGQTYRNYVSAGVRNTDPKNDPTNWVKLGAPAGFTLGTPVTTTSGTAIDFTGIPAGTKRVTINFAGVSTNGTSPILFQFGDSGGIENTGYDSSSLRGTTMTASTAGFILNVVSAADVLTGSITLILIDSANFKWVEDGQFMAGAAFNYYWTTGFKSLSAELTQLRITTVGGTDTFDAGQVNISYE